MSFSWTVRPEDAWGQLTETYVESLETKIVAFANSLTDQITEWMKENARWTDRTGDARANLYSDVIHLVRQSVTILVSHGPMIAYALILETIRGGFYGIIADAVDWWGPTVFHGVTQILQSG